MNRSLWVVGFILILLFTSVYAENEETTEEDAPRKWYKNIVPIPIIITEPAIGEGLGFALGYFHPDEKANNYRPHSIETADTVRDVSLASKPPPTVTGVFGARTNNGTYAVGAGHMNTFREDTIRYLGVAAYANVVSEFFVLDQPFEFTLNGIFVYQEGKFRIAKSPWFAGVALTFLNAENSFKRSPEFPPGRSTPDPESFLAFDFKDVGVKALTMYETRDDTQMPGQGRLFELSITRNDEALGGDYSYTTLKSKLLSFHPLGERWVLGLRGEVAAVSGDPPFFAIPWISMRGIPAMRYQGDEVAMVEAEMRFNFNANWAMVGFGGKGWASSNTPIISTEQSIRAWGFGGRWKALKAQEVWVGLDFAKGPEDRTVYVQVGHPW